MPYATLTSVDAAGNVEVKELSYEDMHMKPQTTSDFISDAELEKMRQAEIDHPATEHTNAGGWCKHCGTGNDVTGRKHLRSCRYAKN